MVVWRAEEAGGISAAGGQPAGAMSHSIAVRPAWLGEERFFVRRGGLRLTKNPSFLWLFAHRTVGVGGGTDGSANEERLRAPPQACPEAAMRRSSFCCASRVACRRMRASLAASHEQTPTVVAVAFVGTIKTGTRATTRRDYPVYLAEDALRHSAERSPSARRIMRISPTCQNGSGAYGLIRSFAWPRRRRAP